MSAEQLEELLLVQERDLALDRLRHRRATLPERAELDARGSDRARRAAAATEIRARRDTLLSEERRLDDESRAIGAHAAEVEQKLYSGSITSPRELQAMQADVDMLKRQQSDVDDRELAVMEDRETLDMQLDSLEREIAQLDEQMAALRAAIAASEAQIDAEIASEEAARELHAAGLPPALLADYERRRERNRGSGAARLVGVTCQACRLSIPSTEAERIRRGGGTEVAYCDNCGAILVP